MKKQRLKPEVRKDAILSAALKLATKTNYATVTREQIAQAVGVTGPAVQYHFGSMLKLRRALMRAAIVEGNAKIVAQGLIAGDRYAKAAPDEIKQKAVTYVSSKI